MAVIYGTKNGDTKNGTLGNDTIYGWAYGGNANSRSGNDTLNGNAGKDKLYGGTGNDSLIGSAGFDTLNGQAGNDTLNGGLGSDTLNGGTGNDTYIIDATINETYDFDAIANDEITEAASSGTDTVVLTIQGFASSDINYYSLDNNLENLTLKGQEYDYGIIVQGNAKNNIIFGGDLYNKYDPGPKSSEPYLYGLQGGGGNDKLYGEAGNDGLAGDSGNDTLIGGDDRDELYGGAGFDSLLGGTGDDSLDGGAGFDSLIGGTGDDIYFIDSATDTIIEYFNQGSDWVISSLTSYTLGENSNLENLELGGGAESGTGNSQNNKIYGNSSNNYLYGAQGNDLLDDFNSSIDDIAYINNIYGELEPSDDYFDGGAGNDTLEAGEGNDSLYGGNGNDELNGEGGNDAVYGGNGNDNLNGGYGVDTLTGGLGLDAFYFSEPSQGIDNIKDFVVADDTIHIQASNADSYYGFGGGLTPNAAITLEQFVTGSAAADEGDRFIYNQNTGALFFDADGTGTTEQVQFAKLSTDLAMTHNDIFVV